MKKNHPEDYNEFVKSGKFDKWQDHLVEESKGSFFKHERDKPL